MALGFVKRLMAKAPKPQPNLMSEQAAAEWLGVSTFTVARERKRGMIGHTVIGNRARYSVDDLKTYVERRTKPCLKVIDFKSGNSSLPNTEILPFGKSDGTTAPPDKLAALALAQKTFLKQKKP